MNTYFIYNFFIASIFLFNAINTSGERYLSEKYLLRLNKMKKFFLWFSGWAAGMGTIQLVNLIFNN